MMLIGSRALAIQAHALLRRPPKDFDFVCTRDELDGWLLAHQNVSGQRSWAIPDKKFIIEGPTNCEFEIATDGNSSGALLKLAQSDVKTLHTKLGMVPSVHLLYALKVSHRYLKNSPHFWKTLADYHLMRAAGLKVLPEHQAFLKLREKETYSYAHPKLNQGKKDFFADDSVIYTYDHDSIHQAVKQLDRPAYQFFKKTEAEVMCSKDKFFACDRHVQLLSVIEESAVLAIERSLVPHPGVMTPQQAWKFALSKVCSSIASGWWREFAYDNAPEISRMYPTGYFDAFKHGLETGIVKPFDLTNGVY